MMRLMAFVVMTCMTAASADAQTARVNQLDWLVGCWQQQQGPNLIEERWTEPRAGMLLGVGRTTRRDSTISFEFMRIFQRRQTVIFEARPNGAEPVEFTTRHTANRAVDFRNPKNDFPQRVTYKYVAADSLHAFIEGPIRGRTRRIDFAYVRVPCQPEATPQP